MRSLLFGVVVLMVKNTAAVAATKQAVAKEYRRLDGIGIRPTFRKTTARRVLEVDEGDNEVRDAQRAFRRKSLVVRKAIDGTLHRAVGALSEYLGDACFAALNRAHSLIGKPHIASGDAPQAVATVSDRQVQQMSVIWASDKAANLRLRVPLQAGEEADARRYEAYASTGGAPMPDMTPQEAADMAAAAERANEATDAARAAAAAMAAAADRRAQAAAAAAATADATAAAEAAAEAMEAEAQRAAKLTDPELPETVMLEFNATLIGQNQMYAIMAVDVATALKSPFRYADEIPGRFVEDWASADSKAHEWYFNATDDLQRDCALRWTITLHQILLRLPTTGGRKGAVQMEQRFKAFKQGEYAKLIKWYLRDRVEAVLRNNEGRQAPSEERAIAKAVRLVGKGEVSKAVGLLASLGLADITDPNVVAQLEAKHPLRKKPMPPEVRPGPRIEIEVRCKGVYRKLSKMSGTGPDGKRNEHLIVLDREFRDPTAARAIGFHEDLAKEFVNGLLPPWFYWVHSASSIVSAITKELAANVTPEVRPIAMGNVVPRAWAVAVAQDARSLFRMKCEPIQVAVGMPGGVSVMALGARAMIERFPRFCAIEIDKKNAYQEISRAEILEALEDDDEMRDYAPYFHAVYMSYGPVFLGHDSASFNSQEGGRQGDPFFCGVYSFATQKCNLKLAEKVRAMGGAAFFDVDDGLVVGPPREVFKAVREYAEDIKGLGESLNVASMG
jgi:hypothetical protein